ncbi:MAG: hypothetical protein IT432_03315 [Phycisphaerales bacterium]|nr:hypothetical protein [Phycisphaerales bacterium]
MESEAADPEQPSMGTLMDSIKKATDWRWRCPTCGRTGSAKGPGGFVFRIGTSGTTRVLGRCSHCESWRMLVLERASDPVSTSSPCAPGTGNASADQERTWSELIAYVSEGTMSAEVANQIAGSAAPEARKREVAAHVAEGAIKPEDVGKLLG